jgi:hypothetical protein
MTQITEARKLDDNQVCLAKLQEIKASISFDNYEGETSEGV